jgi:putative ABC transport system permease protein
MSSLFSELRFALRGWRRAPGFSIAAIATLALGIGATTAIFTTVNAALLKPLPFPHPEDLYAIRTTLTDGRVTTGLVSAVELRKLNEANISIVKAAATTQSNELTLLRDGAAPMKAVAYGVSEGFFDIFGLPMTLGGFMPEHFSGNGPPFVIISARLWRDIYNSDPAIIGKPIRFAEFPPTTIVGVANPNMNLPNGTDMYFNIRLGPTDVGHGLDGYMRVKPGVSIARVRDEMSGVIAAVIKEFPSTGNARVYVTRSLVDQIVGDLRPVLIVVLSAAAVLLLLACVNVTNLLLARGAARAREMAVRVALGAGRGRIVRQLLIESSLLAAVGTALGLALAAGGLRLLMSAGAAKLPRLGAVTVDGTVLVFTLITLVVSSLIVGFAPALRLARTDLKTLINESGRSTSGGRGTARWLGSLMVVEVALSVILVAGAGWLIRSFAALQAVNPGFKTEGRVLFDVGFNRQKFPNPQAVDAAVQDLTTRLQQQPGVVLAGTTSSFPLRQQVENSLLLQFKGEPFDPNKPMGARQRLVGPKFFETMGTKILAGREFGADDKQGAQSVAIINKSFADKYLKGRDPIGQHFMSGYPDIQPQSETEIVGVVEDIRQKTLKDAAEPAFYSSDRQFLQPRRTFVVHGKMADPMTMQGMIRAEVAKTDPDTAVNVISAAELAGDTLKRQELGMFLMMVFGAAALALAAVGIYGVIAYATSQRLGEVATRLALGSTRGGVFWLMIGHGRTLTILGVAVGLALGYGAGRYAASQFYEVRAGDPVILGAAALVVLVIAAVATIIPSARASVISPSKVLRSE